MKPPQRPQPADEPLTRPFWESARRGVLVVQHCSSCGTYQHPPQPQCGPCASGSTLGFRPVSGAARIVSWTRVSQGLSGGFEDSVPYYSLLVELVEQSGLFFVSDHQGDDPAFRQRLKVGALMQVNFEEIDPEFTLPQFRFAVTAS